MIMVKCFLFVLFVACTAIDRSHNYVSSETKIPESVIQPLIDLVNTMINGNDVVLAGLLDAVNASEKNVTTHQQALKDATDTLDVRINNTNNAKAKLSSLQTDFDNAWNATHAAKENFDIKSGNNQTMFETLTKEKSRVSSENVTLQKVRGMIVNINQNANPGSNIETARHLLSVDIKSLLNANPGSIKNLVALIDSLIAAGQDELVTAQANFDAAKREAKQAQTDHGKAEENEQIALGKVLQAKDELTKKIKLEETAKARVDKAEKAFDESEKILEGQQDIYNREKERFERETKSMAEIIQLLYKLTQPLADDDE